MNLSVCGNFGLLECFPLEELLPREDRCFGFDFGDGLVASSFFCLRFGELVRLMFGEDFSWSSELWLDSEAKANFRDSFDFTEALCL